MKKAVAACFLVLASAVAFALPTPKDIESAVRAGNLTGAETMLTEVIAAKPGSAKAHYELGQVLAREGKMELARQQLVQAETLNPSLKFATDPLRFRNLLNQASTPARMQTPTPTMQSALHPASDNGIPGAWLC